MKPPLLLTRHIAALEDYGLLLPAQNPGELEYLFRHSLVQEAAYGSLLQEDRRRLHQLAGQTLEHLYPERQAELASLLADHFLEAASWNQALKYCLQAGDMAYARYANQEAVYYYTQALDIISRAESVDSELAIKLFTRRGRALELSGHYGKSLQNYQEMETLARHHADLHIELAALMQRTTIYSLPNRHYNPQLSRELAGQAQKIAAQLGDHAAEAKITWNLLLLLLNEGQPEQAIVYGEQSLQIARQYDLTEQLAFTLEDLSGAYTTCGQIQRALALRQQAEKLWRQTGNLPMLTNNLASAAISHLLRGEFEDCENSAMRAYRISLQAENAWGQAFSQAPLYYIHLERGEFELALDGQLKSLELSQHVQSAAGLHAEIAALYTLHLGLPQLAEGHIQAARQRLQQPMPETMRSWASINLARVAIRLANWGQAQADLAEIKTPAQDLSWINLAASILARAEYAFYSQDYPGALEIIATHLPTLKNLGVRLHLSDLLLLQARCELALGENETARATLNQALACAEAIGSRRVRWQILAHLGRQEGNRQKFDQARQEVDWIIARLKTPELRAGFANIPMVKSLL